MRKITIITIVMLVAGIISSCGDTSTADTQQSTTTGLTTTTQITTATIVEEAESNVESEANKLDTSIWKIEYYVDKFGDPNPNCPFVFGRIIDGVFSNSAVKNESLTVKILFDDKLAFALYEYNSIEVNNTYSKQRDYEVTFKYTNGEQYTFDAYMYAKSGDRVILNDWGYKAFIKHMNAGETIKVYIEEKERPICNFLFEIDGTGFKDVYKEYQELVSSDIDESVE
ncbi:hypothetical protein [Ruminococcus albus]|uniref:Conserved domain protein n=1 Tax=Ruminococcus albus 8 TaxID=246199 RepID=E9S9K7_RUMAL|nr:hypothetical protein [Ruminococcus albus]EGC04029.1 conserved domain protein [Ruminococcus albus 8]MCC3351136.1 hypothetical protein [Ruminococcus albus 8]